jgi:alpha-D-ribose 1-methylphosphonate 5-triphosphate synthase subunit PhnG
VTGRGEGNAAQADRQRWMSVLAKAPPNALQSLWSGLALAPEYRLTRPPETGMVMTQGRQGGTGDPFCLAEVPVTRCAVELDGGVAGLSYVMGRDRAHAEVAAVCDALLCEGAQRERLLKGLIEPLEAAQAEARDAHSRKSAATKVEFFTMVRGED